MIYDAAEEFASAVEKTVGGGTRIVVLYCYLDKDDQEWVSGTAGNGNLLEKLGAVSHFESILGDDSEDDY